MYPATLHEGAGPRTIRKIRSAFGRTKASRTLTRFRDRCVLASKVFVCGRAVEAGRTLRPALGLCAPDEPDDEEEEGAGV